MRRPHRSLTFWFFVAIWPAVLVAGAIVVGGAFAYRQWFVAPSTSPQSRIVGKWETVTVDADGDKAILQFDNDGTMTMTSDGFRRRSKYKFIDADTVETTPENPNVLMAGLTFVHKISFLDKDQMTRTPIGSDKAIQWRRVGAQQLPSKTPPARSVPASAPALSKPLGKNEVVELIDNTLKFRGRTVTVEVSVAFLEGTLRDHLGEEVEFNGFGANAARLDVRAVIPAGLDVPAAKSFDSVIVSFVCKDGNLKHGNEVQKIVRAK